MEFEVGATGPLQECSRGQEGCHPNPTRNKGKARHVLVQPKATTRKRNADRVSDFDFIVQFYRSTASGALALDCNKIALVVRRIVAKRIGPDHAASQVQVDMRTGSKRRKLPMIGVEQGKQLYVHPAMLDCFDDGLDRRDWHNLHWTFRTASPTRTIPPFRILQFSPERLISGSKIAFPVISSICRQGIDSRVASSSVSPSQN